jgi:hypothetical protein
MKRFTFEVVLEEGNNEFGKKLVPVLAPTKFPTS